MSRKIPEHLQWQPEYQASLWAQYKLEVQEKIIAAFETLPKDEVGDRQIIFDTSFSAGIKLEKTPEGKIKCITVTVFSSHPGRFPDIVRVGSFINDKVLKGISLVLNEVHPRDMGQNLTQFYLVPSNRKINAKLRV